jgi:hypothetical protein
VITYERFLAAFCAAVLDEVDEIGVGSAFE